MQIYKNKVKNENVMSVLRSEYNLETLVDEVWYESTNVIYSKYIEDENENKGDLYVVFREGKTYLYKDVSYMHYLYFKNAAFKDGSSGKALNEYIIKQYAGKKVDDTSIDEILKHLNEPDGKDVTYFIHGDGEVDEFVFHGMYANTIDYVTELSSDARFSIMFSDGYGIRSVKYLLDNGFDPSRITIYMMVSDVEKLEEKMSGCNLVRIKDEKYDDGLIRREIQRRTFEDIAYIPQETLAKISEISKSSYTILNRRMS